MEGMASPASLPEGAPRLVALCRADLIRRTSLSEQEIVLSGVETRDFGDTSLGCPEPGRLYAQVIVPGLVVKLSARGRLYEYHTDRAGRLVLCSSAS